MSFSNPIRVKNPDRANQSSNHKQLFFKTTKHKILNGIKGVLWSNVMHFIFSKTLFSRSVMEFLEYCFIPIPLHLVGLCSEKVPMTKTPVGFICSCAVLM